MSIFFRQSADIDIILDPTDSTHPRQSAEIKTEDGRKEKHLLYYDGETVSGKVIITLKKPGSKLEHQGISVSFIGLIELNQDRGNHCEFASLVKDLAKPGDLTYNASYSFEFVNVEKPHESYAGRNVNLRYFIRVKILRKITNIVKEKEIIVHTLSCYPEVNSPIKMEVGIEDCLHIEFEYNKTKYHLKDVIVGKIYFLLVRIKIKHMEIAIIKKEITGISQSTFNENETIAKYEIMDGAPVRGESIPIRLFLGGYDLTPTLKEINKKFSVKYYLNLVIVDEEDRRYFKQHEIVLWRKGEKVHKPLCQIGHIQAPQQYQPQILQITTTGQVIQQQQQQNVQEQTVTEQTVTEHKVTEQTVTEQTVTEQTATEQKTIVQQVEPMQTTSPIQTMSPIESVSPEIEKENKTFIEESTKKDLIESLATSEEKKIDEKDILVKKEKVEEDA